MRGLLEIVAQNNAAVEKWREEIRARIVKKVKVDLPSTDDEHVSESIELTLWREGHLSVVVTGDFDLEHYAHITVSKDKVPEFLEAVKGISELVSARK